MTRLVVLRPEARAEFDEAFDWYERERAGLGEDFSLRVQEVLDRIAETPGLYQRVFGDVRRAVVRRFPFSVLYRVEKYEILVLAVFHGKRDPSIWQMRA